MFTKMPRAFWMFDTYVVPASKTNPFTFVRFADGSHAYFRMDATRRRELRSNVTRARKSGCFQVA